MTMEEKEREEGKGGGRLFVLVVGGKDTLEDGTASLKVRGRGDTGPLIGGKGRGYQKLMQYLESGCKL